LDPPNVEVSFFGSLSVQVSRFGLLNVVQGSQKKSSGSGFGAGHWKTVIFSIEISSALVLGIFLFLCSPEEGPEKVPT